MRLIAAAQLQTAPKDVLLKHGLPVMEEIKENYSQ